MPRTPILLGAILLLVACSGGNLSTIEDAERYLASRGVALQEKTEDVKQVVAARAFDYQTPDGVKITILQFGSDNAASQFAEVMRESAFVTSHIIERGAILIAVGKGPDAKRQAVVASIG